MIHGSVKSAQARNKENKATDLSGVRGIVSAVQTPFDAGGELDPASLRRLVEDAIAAGVDGFLSTAVAGEVDTLSMAERAQVIETITSIAGGRVPLIAGASSNDVHECRAVAGLAVEMNASAYLVGVPPPLYQTPEAILPFFQAVTDGIELPLVIQDFELNGPGMDMRLICELKKHLPNLAGLKIETVPAGPKYTAVREALGSDFWIAGGWAVQQFIEALDRGVDAMIPEASMVRVYKRVQVLYEQGRREAAETLFRRLLPILAFTNQETANSIAFFKTLLVRKGIFRTAGMRVDRPRWDGFSETVVDGLIDLYRDLEKDDNPGQGSRRHKWRSTGASC